MSRGSPIRPNRVRASASARCSGDAASSAGVLTGPGEIAFTRTPSGVTSRASDLVKPITPPLAAAYAAAGRMDPYSPAVEAKLTIDPARRASMPGSTARQATIAVSRLDEIIAVQSAGDDSAKSTIRKVPATLTSPSTGPSSAAASAVKAVNSSSRVASAGRPQAVRPTPARSLSRPPSPSSLTSVTATRAPCSASRKHTARPIVPAAPLTATTRFSSRMKSSVPGSPGPAGGIPRAAPATTVDACLPSGQATWLLENAPDGPARRTRTSAARGPQPRGNLSRAGTSAARGPDRPVREDRAGLTQVRGHGPAGRFGLPALDRGQHLAVRLDAQPDRVRVAVTGEHASDDDRRDRREQRGEQRVLGGAGHGDVEAHVGGGVGGGVAAAVLHGLQQPFQRRDQFRGGALGGERGRAHLDRLPRLVQVVGGELRVAGQLQLADERVGQVGLARVPDERPAPVDRLDEPLCAQLGQCLPEQRPADAELRGHPRLGGQLLALGQPARRDLAAHLSDQPLDQAALPDLPKLHDRHKLPQRAGRPRRDGSKRHPGRPEAPPEPGDTDSTTPLAGWPCGATVSSRRELTG